MKDFKNKQLLIITTGYPNKKGDIIDSVFVKSQVDELANHFKDINIIVLTPFFPKILNQLKIIKGYKNRVNTQNYKYNNINVYYSKYLKLPNKISYKTFNLYSSILKTIKKNKIKFDLIHAHFIWPCGFIATKLKNKYNKKVIITGHGYDVYDFPFRNKKNKKIIIDTLKKCDYFITVSKNNLKIIESLVNIKNKSILIPNGFDKELFKPLNKKKCRKILKIPLDKKIILTVGNLVPIKNQKALIYAIKKIKINNLICYIIGEGPEHKNLETLIKKLKLEDKIKLLGSKQHTEIPLWMNASDLFILPSYNEGNPTVLFESLGCELPYIGTNVGGVKEIINSDNLGLIYDNPDDYNKLCKLINIGLNKKWSKISIINYSKKFTWKKIIEKIIKVYK
jgi:teichuronic acid biosynthesis glycosyltransferase TuaC